MTDIYELTPSTGRTKQTGTMTVDVTISQSEKYM